jgi:hypothetical protein
MTAVAFVIAPMPAGARWAAHANNENGMAELIAEITMSGRMCARLNCTRPRHNSGSRISAPRVSRISTSGSAPNSRADTRMNRNEAPQIAPRTVSSTGVSQRAATRGSAVAVASA